MAIQENKEETLPVAKGLWLLYTPWELLESFVVDSEIFIMENFKQRETENYDEPVVPTFNNY